MNMWSLFTITTAEVPVIFRPSPQIEIYQLEVLFPGDTLNQLPFQAHLLGIAL